MAAEYTVTFTRSARRELEALDPTLVTRLVRRIEALATTPRPSGCRKLRGSNNLWRIRVGDYRVIYTVSDDERLVDVRVVRHRSAAYE
ncbi:MAG TPA: type II toxin-antitoxin system RelE/ParE family toxin [Gemmatimonadales bacterium]